MDPVHQLPELAPLLVVVRMDDVDEPVNSLLGSETCRMNETEAGSA
jgi:hypothetical protein